MAGTRLFDAGEVALAQTVQEEATRLLRSGSTSDDPEIRSRTEVLLTEIRAGK